jgi:thiol-disulfide isomerase/thioredoxin
MNLNAFVRRGLGPAFLLTALLPLGTGFAQGTGYSSAPKAAPGADEAFAKGGPQQLGQPAANVTGIDAAGAAISLSQFQGKVILLDVSTMWCIFCQRDAAPLEYLYQTYGPKGLAVITCLTQDANGADVTQSGLQQWSQTYHLTLPVMNDTSGQAETAYVGVTGAYPTMVLIDKGFNVQYIEGGLDLPAVTAKIKALLAQ